MPKMVLKFATEQNIDFGHIVRRKIYYLCSLFPKHKRCDLHNSNDDNGVAFLKLL